MSAGKARRNSSQNVTTISHNHPFKNLPIEKPDGCEETASWTTSLTEHAEPNFPRHFYVSLFVRQICVLHGVPPVP